MVKSLSAVRQMMRKASPADAAPERSIGLPSRGLPQAPLLTGGPVRLAQHAEPQGRARGDLAGERKECCGTSFLQFEFDLAQRHLTAVMLDLAAVENDFYSCAS